MAMPTAARSRRLRTHGRYQTGAGRAWHSYIAAGVLTHNY